MNKKYILLIIALLIIPAFASAEYSYLFKQGEEVNLKIACYNESNFYCSSSTACNITILSSDNEVIAANKMMSYNPSYFNYTLNTTQTVKLGEYSSNVNCIGVAAGFSTFNFKITPNGEELSTASGILYAIFFIIGLLLFGFCLFMFMRIKWEHNKTPDGYIIGINDTRYFKLLFFIFCYILAMFLLYDSAEIAKSYLNMNNLALIFSYFFNFMIAVFFPMLIIMVFVGIMNYLTNKNLQKKIMRGFKSK